MSQLLRVHDFCLSADGFGAGEDQSHDQPFGHADPGDMFAWAGATASWPSRTDPGGSRGLVVPPTVRDQGRTCCGP